MRALVLAAGQGERLWPLTEYAPKPLLPVGNMPLLDHIIRALVSSGIHDIVVLTRFESEKVRDHLGDGKYYGCKFTFVLQKKHGGTADAVKSASDEFRNESRFIMIYGDNYYGEAAINRFVTNSSRINKGMCIGVTKVSDASPFGSVEVKHGNVVRINEKPFGHEEGMINTGLYLLEQSVFDATRNTRKSKRGEYELTDSLNQLVEKGQTLRAVTLQNSEWIGVSYPWDLLEVNRHIIESQMSNNRRNSTFEDNVHVKGNIITGTGTIVKSGTYIEGPVRIGDDCTIGPNSYLRPFTSIGNRVKVGASCEIKNSIIMEDTKVPHLSYVGDSIIGKNCNLGAGTITANIRFDSKPIKSIIKGVQVDSGRKKLGAVLGDNVNTGINVSLFPGIKIGPDSWIGPGVTVMQDVGNGSRLSS